MWVMPLECIPPYSVASPAAANAVASASSREPAIVTWSMRSGIRGDLRQTGGCGGAASLSRKMAPVKS